MSHTLLVWGSPVPANVKEAGALIAWSSVFEPSPALAAFVADLLRESLPSLKTQSAPRGA